MIGLWKTGIRKWLWQAPCILDMDTFGQPSYRCRIIMHTHISAQNMTDMQNTWRFHPCKYRLDFAQTLRRGTMWISTSLPDILHRPALTNRPVYRPPLIFFRLFSGIQCNPNISPDNTWTEIINCVCTWKNGQSHETIHFFLIVLEVEKCYWYHDDKQEF